jgi:hypothetical protein
MRAGVVVAFSVEHQVGSGERAVGQVGLVEYRDVRFDLTLLNPPCQVRGEHNGMTAREFVTARAELCNLRFGNALGMK